MKAEYLYHSGDDLGVVNAARVSFAKESKYLIECTEKEDDCTCIVPDPLKCTLAKKVLSQADINLIGYLARGMSNKEWRDLIDYGLWEPSTNGDLEKIEQTATQLTNIARHWVPFTHNSITLRMQAPVPIRVQCFKHKVGFTESEESRRYITSTPELFIPDTFREAAKDKKQGSGGEHPRSDYWKQVYGAVTSAAVLTYERMLNDGLAPEQARFVLPQGCEVNWIWTGNLASYARYYNQRSDFHAQGESNDLAEEVRKIIEPLFPVSWKALCQ